MLENEKILITGCASQVGLPVARELAGSNEVHGLARFRKPADREQVEALGVHCVALDLASDDFSALDDDSQERGIGLGSKIVVRGIRDRQR